MSLGGAAHAMPACTEPTFEVVAAAAAAAAAARPDSFVNIAGAYGAAGSGGGPSGNGACVSLDAAAATIFNKSLPRNFGCGGGKLSAAQVEHAVHAAYGPRKSFSISSGQINEPPVSYRSVLCRIPHRMSRSVDSSGVVQAVRETNEVRFCLPVLFLSRCWNALC